GPAADIEGPPNTSPRVASLTALATVTTVTTAELARSTIAAVASIPPRTTDGPIQRKRVVRQDEGPAGHVDAAAGRRAPRAARSPAPAAAAAPPGRAGAPAPARATIAAGPPARDVAADDVGVQRQGAAVEVDAATEGVAAGAASTADTARLTGGAGQPSGPR